MFLLPILTAFGLFIVIMIIHIFIWRKFKPQSQIAWLFLLFLVLPFLLFLIIFITKAKFSLFNLLSTGLLYLSLACAYIQTYPALQTFAPSLQIIYFLHKAGKEGLNEKQLAAYFTSQNLITDRIDDLIIEKFLYKQGEDLILTSKGKFLAYVFYFYRKLYGLDTGRG